MQRAAELMPWFLAALIAGIALPYLGIVGANFPAVAIFSALTVLVIAYRTGERRISVISAIILIGLSLGSWRAAADIAVPAPAVAMGKHALEGVIVREPDTRETYVAQTVRVDSVDGASLLEPYRVLLLAPHFPEIGYGDRIRATGTFALPEDFATDDSGRVFPYSAYLAKDGIYALVRYPAIELLDTGHGNPILSMLFSMKRTFMDALGKIVPEPENALLIGLILGEKRSLGDTLTNALRVSGIIHIVVLSGYNMTLVARYLYMLFGFLGFYGRAVAAVLGIALFSLMAGAGATVVRAAIMAILALLARVTGRTEAATRMLLLAAVLMLIHEPSIILYDPSFQLSFIATLGLIHGTAYLEPRVRWFRGWPNLREILLSTIATQVFVLPMLLYSSGTLSVYALAANLLALPMVPIAMFLGFWTGVLALFSLILAMPLGFVAGLAATWVLFVGEGIARLPLASIVLPAFSPVLVLVAYGGIAFVLWFSSRSVPRPSLREGSLLN